jgi:hypothetical protein
VRVGTGWNLRLEGWSVPRVGGFYFVCELSICIIFEAFASGK